jgi:hypothetical protein
MKGACGKTTTTLGVDEIFEFKKRAKFELAQLTLRRHVLTKYLTGKKRAKFELAQLTLRPLEVCQS